MVITKKPALKAEIDAYLTAQNRSDLIQSEIDDAKALKQEAKYIKENQEKIINEVHMESKKIIEDAKKISDEIKDNIILEAKKEANDLPIKIRVKYDRIVQKMELNPHILLHIFQANPLNQVLPAIFVQFFH